MSVNSDQTKFNNKLIRQIRVHTGDGASIVRYLVEIMEGEDPTTKGRDRLDAIKMLLGICLNSPAFPSAEDMLLYARCHPDCLCVCEDLPEDHPQVVKMHTPPTAEQREQIAEQQAEQEERDRRTDEQIERKKRADKAWKLAVPQPRVKGRPPHRARGAARASPAKARAGTAAEKRSHARPP